MTTPRRPLTRLRKRWIPAVCLFIVAMISETGAQGAEPATGWPQFLGPGRNGISSETGLLTEWPDGGPKVLWRAACGAGMAGVAIESSQLVTLMQDEQNQYAVSYDASTGRPLWKTPVARAYGNSMGDGPRATPALGKVHAYIYTGDGILAALDRRTGSIVWSANTVKDLGGKIADYGMASSPILTDKLVITTVGAPRATIAAWDRETGQLAWTAGQGAAAGYSSPALLQLSGGLQLVAFHGGGATGIDPVTGKSLWMYPYTTDYDCNIATPILVDNRLLISAGENHGSVLLDFRNQGGTVSPVEVWSSQGVRSVLRAEWQTPVLIDGYLYGLDNVGSAGPVTHLSCVKAATGELVWQQKRFGKSNLIAADGKLFVSTMAGELVVVKATPTGYEEIGRGSYVGQTRQAPVIVAGRLYLRDGKEIVCLDIRAN